MIIDGQWYWFTPKEVAYGVQCSISTVYRAIRSGKLEATRKGRKVLLVGEDAIRDWNRHHYMVSFIRRVEEMRLGGEGQHCGGNDKVQSEISLMSRKRAPNMAAA